MPYFKNNEVIRAAAYLRLSLEDENSGESNSISTQRDITTNYIATHGFELADEYVDDGYTGTNFDRPGFKAMIDDIREGKVNCVVVKDLSRFGRNLAEVGKHLEQFGVDGIRFISVLDNFDTAQVEYFGLDMSVTFKNLMNELYARDISLKVKSSQQASMKKGYFIGTVPPYGYKRDQNDRRRLVIDEECADTVRMIFDWKIGGYSHSSIADRLNIMGVETPLARRIRLSEAPEEWEDKEDSGWNYLHVERILQNEVYTGDMVQGKTGNINYKQKKRLRIDRDQWIRVSGTHEPIISKEVFDYVQDLFGRICKKSYNGEKSKPLSGFVRCADCGLPMATEGSKYVYYSCPGYTRRKVCGSKHSIREGDLNRIVMGAIRMQIEYLVRAKKELEKMGGILETTDSIRNTERKLEELARQEKELRQMLTQTYADRTDGLLTGDSFKQAERHYTDMVNRVEEEIRKTEDLRGVLILRKNHLLPWIESILEFRGMNELRRKAVVMLIDYIYIHEDKSVDIHFRYEDEIKALFEATYRQSA